MVTMRDNGNHIGVFLYSIPPILQDEGAQLKWGFPKIEGAVLGVPIVRTIVYWGSLFWETTKSAHRAEFRKNRENAAKGNSQAE